MQTEVEETRRREVLRQEAASAHNTAMKLLETEQDELLVIELANASLHLWRRVGNEQNLAIAYWLCSRVYAHYLHIKLAMAAAELAAEHLGLVEEPPDWLIASVSEGMARAAVAAKDSRAHNLLAETRRLIALITDPDDRALIQSQFESIAQS